ncbi:MAG: hypothetical protein AABX93_00120 [Nanoarchaeota archaeon]
MGNGISLLAKLQEKKVDLKKVIEKNKDFVSVYYGSSSLDGGHTKYTQEQVTILFASVPEVFPEDWKYDESKPAEERVTKDQRTIINLLCEIERHPAHMIKMNHIPRMISLGRLYAERSFKELKDMKVLQGYD